MNLKEAFRYQNRLQALMDESREILCQEENITRRETTLLKKKALPEAEDERRILEAPSVYADRINDVVGFLFWLFNEHEKLAKAIRHAKNTLNIDMDDIPLHRAVGDSLLTSRVLKAVFDPEKFREYICEVDEEFYRRLNFHTTYLCNLDNPLVDPSQMIFSCPACRKDCVLMTEWKVKSKAFIADLQCPECKKTYRGRVQFKLCYDGVKVQKKLSDMPSVKEQEAENADGDES